MEVGKWNLENSIFTQKSEMGFKVEARGRERNLREAVITNARRFKHIYKSP